MSAQQQLELGGQRGDRLHAARAGVDAALARTDDVERLLVRDVVLAFVHVLYWQRRVELAEENLHIAREVARVATRRHAVGDAGGLEKSVAALSVVRARSGADRAQASLSGSLGRLKGLLGLDNTLELVPAGDLRELAPPVRSAAAVSERADLRALRAEIRQIDAEVELGRASRVPDLALGVGYAREESTDIIKGTLALTLPVFDHGQGVTALAEARRERLRAELDAAAKVASIEVSAAEATARGLSTAAMRFEEGGLATLEHAEGLATTSYEAGAIPLGELLAIRRELVQAKIDYVDLLLGAAIAHAELAASRGGLR